MKVHIILNSHLDPVWLWTWSQGVDEVLSTARTACDILDEYPETILTRGEAWFYATVQEYSPVLFERLKKHVQTGRLQVVGGWWVQADCNLPTASSFIHQGTIAQKYFQENFGLKTSVGYNVDSFGHAGTLPDFYQAVGINTYIMMRPQEHEMHLPSNLFRWQSPNGNELTTFRISRAYCTTGSIENIVANIEATLADADKNIEHTMCFVGVGDHGGGPARREIEWLMKHRNYKPGVELIFSHPRAFFDAISNQIEKLPVVTNELQHHSVGCYSVVHRIKQEVRRAEELIQQAENILKANSDYLTSSNRMALDEAWKYILFNQFHDILAGSSIRSAYEHAYDELGASKTISRRIIVHTTRRMLEKIGPALEQQLFFVNTSDQAFDGYIEFEPWLDYLWAVPGKEFFWRLIQEDDSELAAQQCKPEAGSDVLRLCTKLQIPANGQRVIRIKRDHCNNVKSKVNILENRLSNDKLDILLGNTGVSSLKYVGQEYLKTPMMAVVIDDPSDTWSHNMKGYGTDTMGNFVGNIDWQSDTVGPLVAAAGLKMNCFNSFLDWENRVYYNENVLRIKLRVNWTGHQQVVKLEINPAFKVNTRIDGIPGGNLKRDLNGEEYPIHNFIAVAGESLALAVVSRDIFAADVQPDGKIRLTLLRSPYYAHHTPYIIDKKSNHPFCDQGIHEYNISIMPMEKISMHTINAESLQQSQPVWFAETTQGCKRT